MRASKSPDLTWHWHRWSDWPQTLLYETLRLRSAVFVIEQNCVFPDMDGIDPDCEHLCGTDAAGRVLACARLLPPGLKTPEPSIGRVATAAQARGSGLGRVLMREALAGCAARHPGQPIYIGAQRRLQAFYESFGFTVSDEPYLEDGIWHVHMRRPATVG